jgi:hypothetical protein
VAAQQGVVGVSRDVHRGAVRVRVRGRVVVDADAGGRKGGEGGLDQRRCCERIVQHHARRLRAQAVALGGEPVLAEHGERARQRIATGEPRAVGVGQARVEGDLRRHDARRRRGRRRQHALDGERIAPPIPFGDLRNHARQQHVLDLAAHHGQRRKRVSGAGEGTEVGHGTDRDEGVRSCVRERSGEGLDPGIGVGVRRRLHLGGGILEEADALVAEHPPDPSR